MKNLEQFLKPTQSQLFKMLCEMFENKKLHKSDKNFILVEGDAPIMLLAHLDTVHKEPVRDICKTADSNILMSPQGIGGDDRCGVYALVNAYEMSDKKPYLLFTCDEEIGGIGADYFCEEYALGKLPKSLDELKLLVEVDRRGSNDAVYYNCNNKDFEKYITSKGFKTAHGSFSDISVVAPELGVVAVNLSSGYYNAHQLCEYINRAELDAVLLKVLEIISDADKKDFPKYAYIEKVYESKFYYYSKSDSFLKGAVQVKPSKKVEVVQLDEIEPTPKPMLKEYEDLYYELIDSFGYDIETLEYFRECYGDKIIYELYVDETHPFYQKTAEGTTITAIPEK